MAKAKAAKEEPLEKQLWKAADKLRKNIDAAEYKHVVLGLMFLKYISDISSANSRWPKASRAASSIPHTPRSIVELLVAMLEPYKGRVFDPCCGSGGMFVQSEMFVEEHQGRVNDISIYGQESNQTTWRLAKMNLAIRGIDSSQVRWNNEGSFLNDAHKDLKADYVIANPPFNDSDWSGELLRSDGRWQYGTPPSGSANFAWLQHFVYHLSPTGKAGIVLAKGALTSKTSGEGDIRKALVADGNLIDCIVNLPAKLFLNTQIPAALWFMNRARVGANVGAKNFLPLHPRKTEILFIDARNMGQLINRRIRELSHEDIQKIAGTYHAWLSGVNACPSDETVGARGARPDADDAMGLQTTMAHAMRAHAMRPYEDVRGFCASVPIVRVAELDYVLTPGRYVGLPDEEDDFDFKERFAALKAEFEAQLKQEAALNQAIAENLQRIKL
jgi:type I restriction enzyme M protein